MNDLDDCETQTKIALYQYSIQNCTDKSNNFTRLKSYIQFTITILKKVLILILGIGFDGDRNSQESEYSNY